MALRKTMNSWIADESGATAIEYVLIAGAMALALIPALTSTSTGVAGIWTTISGLWALVTA